MAKARKALADARRAMSPYQVHGVDGMTRRASNALNNIGVKSKWLIGGSNFWQNKIDENKAFILSHEEVGQQIAETADEISRLKAIVGRSAGGGAKTAGGGFLSGLEQLLQKLLRMKIHHRRK